MGSPGQRSNVQRSNFEFHRKRTAPKGAGHGFFPVGNSRRAKRLTMKGLTIPRHDALEPLELLRQHTSTYRSTRRARGRRGSRDSRRPRGASDGWRTGGCRGGKQPTTSHHAAPPLHVCRRGTVFANPTTVAKRGLHVRTGATWWATVPYTGWFLPGGRQARVWRCRKVSDFGDEKVSSRSRYRPPLATARDAQQSEVYRRCQI